MFLRVAITRVGRALRRARWIIASVAFTYSVSLVVGVVMVHSGSELATTRRDQILQTAVQTDPATMANIAGHPIRAALWDFVENATIGAIPIAVSGWAVIFAYPLVIYQGWVGGIVSLGGDGISRFGDIRSIVYYALTLLFQLSGYSIVVGSGVNMVVAILRPPVEYQGSKWLGVFPVEALKDMGWMYVASLPLFLVGSLWEFLSPWNL